MKLKPLKKKKIEIFHKNNIDIFLDLNIINNKLY